MINLRIVMTAVNQFFLNETYCFCCICLLVLNMETQNIFPRVIEWFSVESSVFAERYRGAQSFFMNYSTISCPQAQGNFFFLEILFFTMQPT